MFFKPQKYKIADRAGEPFIDESEIEELLVQHSMATDQQIDQVIQVALEKNRLSLEQTAILLGASSPQQRQRVMDAARRLKQDIYGNRIVLFAPLYIGNRCTNRCAYCSFRADNTLTQRKTLTHQEIIDEVSALEDAGHKRLILVYGEHPAYDAQYIADTVRTTYSVKRGNGEIRRVNINAAPLSVVDFAIVKQAGIGTYQIFQETYHRKIYAQYHLGGKKRDYDWRLTALDRAMEAGIDDVGLGALLGLNHWQFEIMGLLRHVNHLEACFGVGPHTISFPRITEALGATAAANPVSDDDFIYAIAVLRLAVPYTGLILTARESETIRNQAIEYGVSQIDGGTKLEIGSYAQSQTSAQGGSQFTINDNRTLSEIVERLMKDDYIPSFCTACYRKGRTGEHFMEFSVNGFIKRFCTPNAALTLVEYLEDYVTDPAVKERGYSLISRSLEGNIRAEEVMDRIERIKSGERDLYF